MKDQETKDSQKVLSIEEYKKKHLISSTTATGDILQTSSVKDKGEKSASILSFQRKKPSSSHQNKYNVSPTGNIIYMKNYLKSSRTSSHARQSSQNASTPSSEVATPSVKTFDGDNIVMMSEYLKRKVPGQMELSDGVNHGEPSRSAFQRWTAAVAVAVFIMVALPFFNKYFSNEGERGLAGEKETVNKVDSGYGLEEQRARRGPQSLPTEGSSLSVNSVRSAIISAGRKPTREEQLNGY